jgi:Tol biopolymer transport system component
MTHFGVRMMAALVLILGLLTLFVFMIGHMLPEEDELIFSAHHHYGIYRIALTRRLIVPLMNTKNSVVHPDWSPDQKQIAFVDNQSSQLILHIADADGQNAQALTDLPYNSGYDPKWSPDGRYIAYSASNTENRSAPVIELMLFDTQTQTKRRLTTTSIFREHMLFWSPDGTQITFVLYSQERSNSDIYSINIQTGAIRTLISTASNDEYPVWSPDGRYMVFVGGQSQRGIYMRDFETEQSSLLYPISGVMYPSDWSQDGRFIFFNSAYNIYKLEVAVCLKSPKTCTPELLIKNGSDARRKPHLP